VEAISKRFEDYIYFADEDPLMYLVMISGCVSVGKILDSEIYRITQTTFVNLRGALPEDERITEVCKFEDYKIMSFVVEWDSSECYCFHFRTD
jgi:hypothetical protein